MTKPNAEIKKYAWERGVKLWHVAYQLGMNDGNFSRKLRRELSPQEREKIIAVIDELAAKQSQQPEISAAPDNLLPIPKKISDNCRRPSAEEGYAHILRGLISYHERMTMGDIPQKDFYLDALKFALTCVEEKIPR